MCIKTGGALPHDGSRPRGEGSASTRIPGKVENPSQARSRKADTASDAFVLDFLAALMKEIIRRCEA